MPGMPMNGQGGQFGASRYGWGDVPGAGGGQSADSGLDRGRYTNSPEAGLHRGEWQWRGHAPDAQRSYGWDYQGGVGRDEITQRTEARMGPSFQSRMAQERGGGLPRGRYAIEYDQGRRTGGGSQDVSYDWGWQGRSGGMDRSGSDYRGGMRGGGMNRGYGNDFRGGYGVSGSGRGGYGQDVGGHGPARGYGSDFRGGGYGASGGFGGRQQGGGYGSGHPRGYDRGMGGGYGRGGERPLSDAEFYQRVERW